MLAQCQNLKCRLRSPGHSVCLKSMLRTITMPGLTVKVRAVAAVCYLLLVCGLLLLSFVFEPPPCPLSRLARWCSCCCWFHSLCARVLCLFVLFVDTVLYVLCGMVVTLLKKRGLVALCFGCVLAFLCIFV